MQGEEIRAAQAAFSLPDPRELNPLQLAYVGDTLHDLYVRSLLVSRKMSVGSMHKQAVRMVSAAAQAAMLAAIENELTEQEVSKNKAIRGYIVRALAKGSQNALLVRQITNALVADGLIYSPDISKPIEYLQEAGYVTFTDRSVNAYNAYRKDSIIKLTRKGVDLVEGTINDPGIDV